MTDSPLTASCPLLAAQGAAVPVQSPEADANVLVPFEEDEPDEGRPSVCCCLQRVPVPGRAAAPGLRRPSGGPARRASKPKARLRREEPLVASR